MWSKLMFGVAALAALSMATLVSPSLASNQLEPNQPEAMQSLAADDRDLSALFCGIGHPRSLTRIYGGNDTSPGQFPWMVNIKYYDWHICGGVIISDKLILTAKHCLEGKDLNRLQFYIGDHKQYEADGELLVDVDSVVLHPQDDFALVKTRAPMSFLLTQRKLGSVNRICLPRRDWKREAGTKVTVAGWGLTEQREIPNTLREVDVSIKSCELAGQLQKAGTLCATADHGKDACVGDSGGPLMFEVLGGELELVGLVLDGPKQPCGDGSEDGIYANVHHYLQWIIDNY